MDLFAQILENVFKESQNSVFDDQHKYMVNNYIQQKAKELFITHIGDENYDQDFSLT